MEIILEETHYNFFLLFFILKTRERLQKNTNELSLIYLRMKEVRVLIAQLCPTLCDPMDCSPLGSSVHRIIQAVILEWVAMPSSRGSSQLEAGSPASQVDSLPAELPRKPNWRIELNFTVRNGVGDE